MPCARGLSAGRARACSLRARGDFPRTQRPLAPRLCTGGRLQRDGIAEPSDATTHGASAADAAGGGADDGPPRPPRRRRRGGDADGSSGPNRGPAANAPLPPAAALAAALLSAVAVAPPSASARRQPQPPQHQPETGWEWLDTQQVDSFVDRAWAVWGPLATAMGVSGLAGMCAAALIKAVGRAAVVALGASFVVVQALAHVGVLSVDWERARLLARQVTARALDVTGDGRVTAEDVKAAAKRGMDALTQGVPSTSGFLLGFLLGMRMW